MRKAAISLLLAVALAGCTVGPHYQRPAALKTQTYTSYTVPLELGWEIDLWGRVRRQTEAARARLAAAADDVEALKLLFQAEVATDYFTLRALDAEAGWVAASLETYRRSL